jgi:hypothetical protein
VHRRNDTLDPSLLTCANLGHNGIAETVQRRLHGVQTDRPNSSRQDYIPIGP